MVTRHRCYLNPGSHLHCLTSVGFGKPDLDLSLGCRWSKTSDQVLNPGRVLNAEAVYELINSQKEVVASVIIPTHNAADTISRQLEALA